MAVFVTQAEFFARRSMFQYQQGIASNPPSSAADADTTLYAWSLGLGKGYQQLSSVFLSLLLTSRNDFTIPA